MKISKTPEVKRLATATFPNYTGRKFSLTAFTGPMTLRSFWDEGSRCFYKFVNVDSLDVHEVHSNHPFFEASQPSSLKDLPPGIVLVCRTVFMGREEGLCFYVRLDEMPKFLPAPKAA